MDVKDFIEKFIEAVEVENPTSVKIDTKFRELDEWSSISTLSVIAMADEEYGVELNPDVFRGAETVEDLFKAIEALQ